MQKNSKEQKKKKNMRDDPLGQKNLALEGTHQKSAVR